MRAADAEADFVVVKSEDASSPSTVAAEVADSAAILDKPASPAPIDDEEAGRIGERRLSMTPIPQVADTAAEVADSAALLDGDRDGEHGPLAQFKKGKMVRIH
jgi:hypothetical protein